MAQAFAVPSQSNYVRMYGNLVSGSQTLMAVQCMSQCTGCKCSCKCSCKAVDDTFDFEW